MQATCIKQSAIEMARESFGITLQLPRLSDLMMFIDDRGSLLELDPMGKLSQIVAYDILLLVSLH